jgi:hypothetical protein
MFVDYIVTFLFVAICFVYFLINILKNKRVSEETVAVGIFAITFVAYCFIFAHYGFTDPVPITFTQFPYLILAYGGKSTTLRLIARNHPKNLKMYDSFQIKYLVYTGTFIILNLLFISTGICLRNNTLLMMIHIFIPIYLGIMLGMNFQCWIRDKALNFKTIITNYTLVAFSIGLYEFYDVYMYVKYYVLYKIYGVVTIDKTHSFDIFWISVNFFFLLFLPRIRYAIKTKDEI